MRGHGNIAPLAGAALANSRGERCSTTGLTRVAFCDCSPGRSNNLAIEGVAPRAVAPVYQFLAILRSGVPGSRGDCYRGNKYRFQDALCLAQAFYLWR